MYDSGERRVDLNTKRSKQMPLDWYTNPKFFLLKQLMTPGPMTCRVTLCRYVWKIKVSSLDNIWVFPKIGVVQPPKSSILIGF